MSEVIEDFIRRHPGMRQEEAFEGFLQQDRIKAWVGADTQRRERLRTEFTRVWSGMHGSAGGTRGPVMQKEEVRVQVEPRRPEPRPEVKPEVRPEPRPAPPRVEPRQVEPAGLDARPRQEAPARRLQLLCATCSRMDVWKTGATVTCRHCGRVYDDMLDLIPVRPVGPFEFIFGEGWTGVATAGGVALLLVALYGVLRWLR